MNQFKQGEAILTKDTQIGCGSKKTLKAGTRVTIEFKENPDDSTSYILCRDNFRGLISQDSFRWAEQQQYNLFARND
jgi:hypothetical protein